MIIDKVLIESKIDYPGKYGPIFFTRGCNFKCGFCYNSESSDLGEEDLERLFKDLEIKARRGWYNGACISGGEPTIHPDLPEFIMRLRKIGVAVKLDTNGSNPEMLKDLLGRKIVDYVAMDVKCPKGLYGNVTGNELDVSESMKLVTGFPDYEFRTTIAPIPRDNGLSFMSVEEVGEIAKWISEVNEDSKYYIQKFIPVKGRLLDKRLEEFPETDKKLLEEMKNGASKYLTRVYLR